MRLQGSLGWLLSSLKSTHYNPRRGNEWDNRNLRLDFAFFQKEPYFNRLLRAWRAPKQTHGTEEARRVPAALTTRAKQEGRRNDKKRHLAFRESDRLIVSSGNPAEAGPTLEKGPTCWRSPHRQPVP